MTDILLATMNARYIHTAFGLRYLHANMGSLAQRCHIVEFGIKERPMDVVERLLAHEPKLVGLGVYIWNVKPLTEVVILLKQIAPQVTVVLGGPEVSYETHEQAIVAAADVVVTGEADHVFGPLCEDLLAGRQPAQQVLAATPPTFDKLNLPYALYTDEDVRHRHIYVEASRGCPFTCEFCLSSLDIPVRRPDVETFLDHMDDLLTRGARHFKFVDRTFNLHMRLTRRILTFFLARYVDGLFLHFEMVPDRLPAGIRDLIAQFPAGALQFEIGIQTFAEDVAERIRLRRDHQKTADNFKWLRAATGVHIHADLIAGLPGEDLQSFADGFDRLYALGPQEIQVGILKRLRGTPITRHEAAFQLRFSPYPPYEILSTRDLDYRSLQRLRRFSQLWDRAANSGAWVTTLPLLWGEDAPFWAFWHWSDWVATQMGRSHSIAADRLARLLMRYLVDFKEHPVLAVATSLRADYLRLGRPVPPWVMAHVPSDDAKTVEPRVQQPTAPNTQRQRGHQTQGATSQ